MSKERVFLVAGGDMRSVHLANLLARENAVYAAGFGTKAQLSKAVRCLDEDEHQQTRQFDCLILPLPASGDGIHVNTPLYDGRLLLKPLLAMEPGLVLGGMTGGAVEKLCAEQGVKLVDYFKREELTVLNAIPTAEGVIQIAMEELPTTIFGRSFLVTGFGRTAKVLVKSLLGLGAKVTVAVRKHEDMAWIKVYGARAVHIGRLENIIGDFDVIINSVPAKIFTGEVLKNISDESLLIDIASKPGGVDFDMARECGVKTIWALSLPGKVAPYTSGEFIYNTVQNIICEEL